MFFGLFDSSEIKRIKNGIKAAKDYRNKTRQAMRLARLKTYRDTKAVVLIKRIIDDHEKYELKLSETQRDYQDKFREYTDAENTLKLEKKKLKDAKNRMQRY